MTTSLDGVRHVFGEPDGTFLYGETATGAASGYDATIGDVPRGYADRLGWTRAAASRKSLALFLAYSLRARWSARTRPGTTATRTSREPRRGTCATRSASRRPRGGVGRGARRDGGSARAAGLADGRLPRRRLQHRARLRANARDRAERVLITPAPRANLNNARMFCNQRGDAKHSVRVHAVHTMYGHVARVIVEHERVAAPEGELVGGLVRLHTA